MGFTSGAVSFCRFFMRGRRPRAVDDAFIEAVRRNAFGRSSVGAGEQMEVGWISPRHLFDVDITADKIAVGRYALLHVRMDRVSIPPAVLRSYVRQEEESAQDAAGRPFLNKTERRKARDLAQRRAEKEAREGAFRRMAAAGVLMDLQTGVLLLASTGETACEKLSELVRSTFEISLDRADAHRLAYRILDAQGRAQSLEHLSAFHLVHNPYAEEEDEAESAGDGEDHSFLGREFLTWLWHESESDRGRLALEKGPVALAIDKSMRLECGFGRLGSVVITRSGPAASREAHAALACGKQPTRMGLIVGAPSGEFTCAIDGPRMNVSALMLPQDGEKRDYADLLEHRFETTFDAVQTLDGLYGLFLRHRTGGDWAKDLKAMTAWARRHDGVAEAPSARVHAVHS